MLIEYGAELQPHHDAMVVVELMSQHVSTNYSKSKNNITNPNFGNDMGFVVRAYAGGKRMLVCVNKQYDPMLDTQNMERFINWCNPFLVNLSIGPFQLLPRTTVPCSVTHFLEVIPGQLHVASGHPGHSFPMFSHGSFF